jgi:hypothetical protein
VLARGRLAFEHLLDQVDAPARAVELVAEQLVGRAGGGAEAAVHALAQDGLGLAAVGALPWNSGDELGLHESLCPSAAGYSRPRLKMPAWGRTRAFSAAWMRGERRAAAASKRGPHAAHRSAEGFEQRGVAADRGGRRPPLRAAAHRRRRVRYQRCAPCHSISGEPSAEFQHGRGLRHRQAPQASRAARSPNQGKSSARGSRCQSGAGSGRCPCAFRRPSASVRRRPATAATAPRRRRHRRARAGLFAASGSH